MRLGTDMQSASVIGRLLVRAFSTRSQSELQFRQRSIEPLNFVTGSSGFSKTIVPTSQTGTKKWTYGDDAFFIARHKLADVIGLYCFFLALINVGFVIESDPCGHVSKHLRLFCVYQGFIT